jgi:hypothetical protein
MADLQSAALATWLRSREQADGLTPDTRQRYGSLGELVKFSCLP